MPRAPVELEPEPARGRAGIRREGGHEERVGVGEREAGARHGPLREPLVEQQRPARGAAVRRRSVQPVVHVRVLGGRRVVDDRRGQLVVRMRDVPARRGEARGFEEAGQLALGERGRDGGVGVALDRVVQPPRVVLARAVEVLQAERVLDRQHEHAVVAQRLPRDPQVGERRRPRGRRGGRGGTGGRTRARRSASPRRTPHARRARSSWRRRRARGPGRRSAAARRGRARGRPRSRAPRRSARRASA